MRFNENMSSYSKPFLNAVNLCKVIIAGFFCFTASFQNGVMGSRCSPHDCRKVAHLLLTLYCIFDRCYCLHEAAETSRGRSLCRMSCLCISTSQQIPGTYYGSQYANNVHHVPQRFPNHRPKRVHRTAAKLAALTPGHVLTTVGREAISFRTALIETHVGRCC